MAKHSEKKHFGTDDDVQVTNLSEVRRNFAAVVNDSQRAPVVIQRHGKPQAVLVGVDSTVNLAKLISELTQAGFVAAQDDKAMLGIRTIRKLTEVLAESRLRARDLRKKRPLKSHQDVLAILRKR